MSRSAGRASLNFSTGPSVVATARSGDAKRDFMSVHLARPTGYRRWHLNQHRRRFAGPQHAGLGVTLRLSSLVDPS